MTDLTDSPSMAVPATGVPGDKKLFAAAGSGEADNLRQLMNGIISMLSHDLRAPLSAISSWLFLLESDKLDPAGRTRALAKIRSNVEEQVQLIDDALLLSRCKTGHVRPDMARTSPVVHLSAAFAAIRPAASARGISLNAPAPAEDANIDADPEQLRRAFGLLLAHVVNSVPAGATVETLVQARAGIVRISIAEHGREERADMLPFSAARFCRSEDALARPGRGAERGLLLASALVEAQDGRLLVANAGEGIGAAIAVELPSSGAGR